MDHGEGSSKLDLVTELLVLYQSAVEYYDSIGDRKTSGLFSSKIQLLFLKPQISTMFAVKEEKK